MHTVFDLSSKKPIHFTFTSAKINDVEEGQKIDIEPNTTYVFDRGYIHFNWWNEIIEKGAYFVTRPTRAMGFIRLTEVIKKPDKISYQFVKLRSKWTKRNEKGVKTNVLTNC